MAFVIRLAVSDCTRHQLDCFPVLQGDELIRLDSPEGLLLPP